MWLPNNANNSVPLDGPQVVVFTLEKSFTGRVRSEVDHDESTIETRIYDAILTARERLVIPRVDLAMKSVNTFSGRDIDSIVPDPDQRNFSGNIEGLQMTAQVE